MVKKWLVGLVVLALLVPFATLSMAQETSVKGNLGGLAVDSTGAVVTGAAVTLTGPTGSKTDKTDEAGNFMFPLLTPGFYAVKVEKQGFKTATVKAVQVEIGKTSAIRVTLEPGAVSEIVEVTSTAVVIDTTSSTVGANLPDTFYESVPVPRNVAGLFYITPGAVSGGGTGAANPSISGSSGLENLYIADGVNITDKSFGGLGVFSRRYGSVGSGINLSFIKEVSVKSAGFEPQYGQATGGVVSIVTKSGGNAYHGQIAGYFAPQSFEATALQSDLVTVNKFGYYFNQGAYEAEGEIGGYIPGSYFKDHLFFFASVDPTWNQQYVGAALPSFLYTMHPEWFKLQADVFNYAGKLSWKINDNHSIESSIFGDPSRTTTGPNTLVLAIQNATGFSRGNYGTRNWVVRYNGTISPSWLVNGSFSWNNSKFTETPLFDVPQVTNRISSTNVYPIQGIGYYEDFKNDSYALNFDTQKIGHWLGQHTLSVGYRYERDNYTDFQTTSGVHPVIPANGFNGQPIFPAGCIPGNLDCPIGQTAWLWSGSMRQAAASCTQCPIDPLTGVPVYVSFGRGDYQPGLTPTFGRYHAAYASDSWEINKHINITAGLRWEQWRMVGTVSNYAFTDNWAPRVGIAIDPWGDHKTKIYANFGRYNYQTPLDAAIRSLSGELDVTGLRFAPEADAGNNLIYNADHSINMILDQAHILNNQTGGSGGNAAIGGSLGTGFAPATKMMYQNEWVVGASHQFHNGVVLEARFIYRNLPRTLDDVSGVSPESYVWGGTPTQTIGYQNYFIANPGPKLDIFPNMHEQILPTGTCPAGAVEQTQPNVVDANGGLNNPATGTTWIPAGTSICYSPGVGAFSTYFGGEVATLPNGMLYPIADGIPDGFPLVIHNYKAVEVEVNKAFSNNWMLRANWRIARLYGNYEGAFRNDNGQTDPNISSLFDFTNGAISMLGDQYTPGPLNTDRTHVVNVYTSYVFQSTFLKNLELGVGAQFQSGAPINKLADHPAYGNSGEVPLGGRGALGRLPVTGTLNLHLDRPFKVTEKSQLHLTADLFNVTNNKAMMYDNQNYQLNFSPDLNPDFLNVSPVTSLGYPGYQRPFYARMSFRWVF